MVSGDVTDRVAPAASAPPGSAAKHGGRLRPAWKVVTLVGGMPATLLCAAAGYALSSSAGTAMLVDALAIFVAANLMKYAYFKPRPDNEQGVRPPLGFFAFNPARYLPPFVTPRTAWENALAGWRHIDAGSFPSVHTARAVNLALLWIAYAPAEATYLRVVLPALAVLVAASRVALRRHDLVDVTCGALLGGGTAALTVWAG